MKYLKKIVLSVDFVSKIAIIVLTILMVRSVIDDFKYEVFDLYNPGRRKGDPIKENAEFETYKWEGYSRSVGLVTGTIKYNKKYGYKVKLPPAKPEAYNV